MNTIALILSSFIRGRDVQNTDGTCPKDSRVETKEDEKVDKYRDLVIEIKALWKTKMVKIVLFVIGCLGTIPKRPQGNLKE